jgi:flavin-dependent dehydrogenase
MQPCQWRVIIIGGSVAGLLAAAAVADQAGSVLVVDRDRFPAAPTPRAGVPQGSHQHVLLHRGLLAAEQLVTGVREDLATCAPPSDSPAGRTSSW